MTWQRGALRRGTDHHLHDAEALLRQERLAAEELRHAQVRQVLLQVLEERLAAHLAQRRQVVAVGADRGGELAVAHDAFEVARVAGGELHHHRPLRHRVGRRELLEQARVDAEVVAARDRHCRIAARLEAVVGERLAQHAGARAAPDVVEALVGDAVEHERLVRRATTSPNVLVHRDERGSSRRKALVREVAVAS
jgi:hypothetical protein